MAMDVALDVALARGTEDDADARSPRGHRPEGPEVAIATAQSCHRTVHGYENRC